MTPLSRDFLSRRRSEEIGIAFDAIARGEFSEILCRIDAQQCGRHGA